MTKKIYIFIFGLLLVGLVFGAVSVKAQTEAELPSAGLTPASPFYFMERFFEGVGTFFTFGDVSKAERYAKLAAERVAEAKAVVDKGKPEVAEKALTRYQDQIGKSLAKAEEAQAKGKSVSEVTEIVSQATAKHLTVLEEVLERVPEQAKPAILQAREVSKTGQVRALEGLAKEKPERAANLNIQTIQNRLGKMKNEAREGDEEGVERTLADFAVFRTSLEKMGKENKMVLASLVSEDMTGQIEDLDEIEEVQGLPIEAIEGIIEARKSSIEGQIEVLKALSEHNPERATEINLRAAEARLNKAKEKGEELEERDEECQVKCEGNCQKEEIEPCIFGCVELVECSPGDEECLTQARERCEGACQSKIVLGECVSQCSVACTQEVKEKVEEGVAEFENQHKFGEEISQIAQGIGKDTTTIEQLVARATTHHLEVLNDVYNKVPEQAKEAIEKAMTVSETGRQQAVEALKGKGALENIPETVPVPWEVKERVFEERGTPKPEIPKKEEAEKPEVEKPEVEEIEKPEVEKPEKEEVEKPEVEKPETSEVSPGPPAQ